VWILIIAAVVVLALAGAAWSDHRDRKQGLDPAERAKGVHERRQAARQLRRERLPLWIDKKTRVDQPEPKPWER